MNPLARFAAFLRRLFRPDNHVRALLAELKAQGVARFEGCGVKVEFLPPPPAEGKQASFDDPAQAQLRRVVSLLGGGR